MSKQKIDNLVVGIILGMCLPIVVMFAYYMFTYRSQTSFAGFLDYFTSMHIIVAAMSLSVYASNLPLFFGFIWGNMNKAARGVLYSTMAYTGWVIYEKFIG